MCGFAGIVDPERQDSPRQMYEALRGMTATLQHRGPDDEGFWLDPRVGVGLGFQRLSIVDLSPQGHQPMESPDERYVLVFNGEIYNHLDLRARLRREGEVGFRGTSDTEVLLRAIGRWGLARALEYSVGMFALAVWDRQERRLQLARDRVGEKPLYYGWSDAQFLFGSELKAFSAHPRFRPELDREMLVPYLRHGYIPSPRSIYKGISKLRPGTILTLELANLQPGELPSPTTYWSSEAIARSCAQERFSGTPEEATEILDGLIRESVRQQRVADVPLGAFLSGGVDSSTLVGILQSMSSKPVHTFTIGFEDRRHDEAGHARVVAEHLGTLHSELYVTPAETLDVIPSLPGLFDEPFADSSQVPTYLVAKLARRSVTVGLSGDGGDELFAGYDWYTRSERLWNQFGWMPRSARRVLSKAVSSVRPGHWDRLLTMFPGSIRGRANGDRLHKLATILDAMQGPASPYQSLISRWSDPGSACLGPLGQATGSGPESLAMVSDNLLDNMQYRDFSVYLPDDILTKVDRATMAVGLESRAPLLDHRIIEFAWRLPRDLKVRNGQQKWLLRQVLARYVPTRLVDRPKTGFCLPFGTWLRGPLRDWAESLLDDRKLRDDGLFDSRTIRRVWQEHLSGERNWQQPIWSVLMFQAWLHNTTSPQPQPLHRAISRHESTILVPSYI